MDMDEKQQYTVKVMLDDITFMLFDLERGKHIQQDGEFYIGEVFRVIYKRTLLSEIIEHNSKEIVSDFTITIYYNDRESIKFETRGELRKFTVFLFDGFICGMFVDMLESFRKEKFL